MEGLVHGVVQQNALVYVCAFWTGARAMKNKIFLSLFHWLHKCYSVVFQCAWQLATATDSEP